MKIFNFIKKEFVGLTSSLGILIYLAIIYEKLPDSVPLHYTYNGVVDEYGDKTLLWTFAIIPFIAFIGMFFSKMIDPRKENYEKFESSYGIIRNVLTLFLSILMLVSLLLPIQYEINIPLGITITLSFLFIILGNYLLTVKQNYFLGIKTPWTLSSEEVWRKTHRLGGYEFIVLGVISIITALLKFYIVLLIGLAFVIIHLTIYSYLEYQKEISNKYK